MCDEKLCLLEKSLFYHCLAGDLVTLAVAVVKNEAEMSVGDSMFKLALRYMQKRHPLLRSYIKSIDSELFFSVRPLDQVQHVQLDFVYLQSQDELNDKLVEFNSQKFERDEAALWWRCRVIRLLNDQTESYLCLSIPLILTDGINITTLLIEIVNILNALLQGEISNEMMFELELCDNIEELCHKYKLSTEKQLDGMKRLKQLPGNEFLLPKELRSTSDTGSKINLFRFNREQTESIMRACKENRVKVTGFLNAAIFFALEDLYSKIGIEFPSRLSSGVSVNYRLRYEPNLDFSHMKTHVGLIKINMDMSQNIWELSRSIDSNIEQATSTESGALLLGSHDFESYEKSIEQHKAYIDGDKSEQLCQEMRKEFDFHVAFSNLGKWVHDRKGRNSEGKQLKIDQIYYGDSLDSSPFILVPLIFHTIYWNGELQFLLSSNKSDISSEYCDQLVEFYKSVVINLACKSSI